LWNCVMRSEPDKYNKTMFHTNRINQKKKQTQAEFIVDIGIWGEPNPAVTGKVFYNYRDVRALQLFLRYPSIWGVLYLTPSELSDLFDAEKYQQLRSKFHAEDTFTGVEKKLRLQDPTGSDKTELVRGPIPQWRLYREWKSRHYGTLVVIALILIVSIVVAVGLPLEMMMWLMGH